MPRSSMTALIARVSALVNDSSNSVFSTDVVQDALDLQRLDLFQVELQAVPRLTASGAAWLDYFADSDSWEADAVLDDGTWTAISSGLYTPDYLTGRWTFAASQTPPVYLTGKTYDVYAAAADLCEQRAGLVAEQFSFSTPHGSVSLGQKFTNWSALAAQYRAQARVRQIRLTRDDLGGW